MPKQTCSLQEEDTGQAWGEMAVPSLGPTPDPCNYLLIILPPICRILYYFHCLRVPLLWSILMATG